MLSILLQTSVTFRHPIPGLHDSGAHCRAGHDRCIPKPRPASNPLQLHVKQMPGCSLRGWNSCADVSFHDLNCRVTGLSEVPRYDCNGTPAQKWFIQSGSTMVQLAGTKYCLDAGACKYDVDLIYKGSEIPLQRQRTVSGSRSGHASRMYPPNNGFIQLTFVSRCETKVILLQNVLRQSMTNIYRVLRGFSEWHYD